MPAVATSRTVARQEILAFASINKSVAASVQRLLQTSARALSMPAAFTAFYDVEGQLNIHSWHGFDTSASPESGFLAFDYASREGVMEIHDAAQDADFAHDVWVTNGGVRFYACVPIKTTNGALVGILAVLDSEPRTLTSDQNRLLIEFGRLVSESIILRLDSFMMRQTAQHAEKLKQQAEMRLERMIASLPLPMFVVNRNGGILSWNRACTDRFGYTPEESIGQSILEHVVPEDERKRIETLIERVYNRRRILGISMRLMDREGVSIPVVSRLFPFFDAGGNVESCVFIHSEAPAMKSVEREVKMLENGCREIAEDLERLKATFLDNMSHEICAPLTSIIGFADILHEHVDDSNRQFTRLIENSAQQLKDTLTAMLELAQIKGHSLELHPEPLDILDIARSMGDDFAERAAEKDLHLHVGSDSDAQTLAIVDAASQKRVMQYLLDNAIKYTRKGEVSVHVHSDETHVIVEVKDTGVGISKEFLPHIFEEFLQEPGGLSRGCPGSGLGLAITRRLVELMSGTIEVESKRGEGSTFRIRYPLLVE